MKATHSGTCQCCGNVQKLPNGVLSKHGYTVDFGYFNGVEWKAKTGVAVMRGTHGWVLNMGGRYGTPGIASESNTVKVN